MSQKNERRWRYLTVMSFIFYGWWDWRFLFLILISGLIDYFAGKLILKRPQQKRMFLIISLLGNLGGLAVFKYSEFFAKTIDRITAYFGATTHLQDHIPAFALIVPVGISFYTFQSMSYTIDIYRGRLKPVGKIFHFFAYLTMFPQLVAGPIVRAKDLLGQLAQKRQVSGLQKWHALKLIMFGLFQKTVLADNIGVMVNQAYHAENTMSGTVYWWVIILGFTFQIYCDFSGYSLMARGLAKYMGYHFKMNFNHPYLSSSFKSFWSRWHISLSTWFRDYVYIPLGGNRKGLFRGLFFVMITMLVSGLWHGAGITFLIWGFLHGLYLSTERLLFNRVKLKNSFLKLMAVILIFVFTAFAWNFFRADGFSQALEVSKQLLQYTPSSDFVGPIIKSILFLGLAVLIELIYAWYNNSFGLKRHYRKYNYDVLLVSLCLLMHLFFRGPAAEFIYFQF